MTEIDPSKCIHQFPFLDWGADYSDVKCLRCGKRFAVALKEYTHELDKNESSSGVDLDKTITLRELFAICQKWDNKYGFYGFPEDGGRSLSDYFRKELDTKKDDK